MQPKANQTIRRNMVLSAAAVVAAPVSQLFSAPYLVHHLGLEAYGIMILVNSIVVMSGLTSAGMGDATIKFVAEFAATGRKEAMVDLLRTTLFIYAVLGSVTVAGLEVLAPFLARHIFNVGPELVDMATLGIRVGAFLLAVRLVYSVGEAFCRGLRRHDIESTTSVLNSILVPVVSCYLVSRGHGFVAVILSNLCVFCFSTLIIVWRASLLARTARWLIPVCRWENVKRLTSYSAFAWLQMLDYLLCNQADRFIVSSVLGAAAVAPYAICLQISQLIHSLVAQTFSYIFPLTADLCVKEDWFGLRRLYLTGMQLTTLSSFSAATLFFVYGNTILFTWMGSSLGNYDPRMVFVLATYNILMGITIVPCLILNGAGYVRLNSIIAISSSVAILPGALVLARLFGMVGMVGSRLLNLLPNILLQILTGRIVMKNRGVWVNVLPIVLALAGIAMLWSARVFASLPVLVADHPWMAFGVTISCIGIMAVLVVLAYRTEPVTPAAPELPVGIPQPET